MVFLSQPVLAMRLGLGPPALHFSMVPLSSVISKLIHTCGLPQSNCVSVPLTLVRFAMSYRCQEQYAYVVSETVRRQATKLPINSRLVFMMAPPPHLSCTFDAILKRWVSEFLDDHQTRSIQARMYYS